MSLPARRGTGKGSHSILALPPPPIFPRVKPKQKEGGGDSALGFSSGAYQKSQKGGGGTSKQKTDPANFMEFWKWGYLVSQGRYRKRYRNTPPPHPTVQASRKGWAKNDLIPPIQTHPHPPPLVLFHTAGLWAPPSQLPKEGILFSKHSRGPENANWGGGGRKQQRAKKLKKKASLNHLGRKSRAEQEGLTNVE